MSGGTYNQPAQPSYGEGMAEALTAQAEFLRGTGDFADVGSLESLLPLEERIRKQTAQTDTDILRQTLLGGERTIQEGPTGEQVELKERGDLAKRVVVKPNSSIAGIEPGAANFPDGDALVVEFYDTRTGEVANSIVETYYPDKFDETRFDHSIGMRAATQSMEEGRFDDAFAQAQAEYANLPSTSNPLPTGTVRTERTGDGMLDLLGDTRQLTEYETRTATQADVDAGLAEEVGDSFVQSTQTDNQAGFRGGEFKGLSTLAEDIQRGNLSRQREADLQDVSRLSGLYSDIMEDYKPGTSSALSGAKDLIEEQKDNLMRDVGISDPAQVTSQGVQADPLRQNLMLQANEALGQGLTDRERRLIDESERARATLMGRTFDQKSAIEDAKAQVLEDNQRKMQNRAFAQSVLGQESGIQTADDTRAIGADQFNVGTKMDAERLRESLRMQGLLGYLDAASRISQIENQDQLDPFQAILGRGGGTALQQGQSVLGQANYGLQSAPQYLNPEAGLGFIQNQATNAANMYGATQAGSAARQAGIFGGLGSLGGGIATGFLMR